MDNPERELIEQVTREVSKDLVEKSPEIADHIVQEIGQRLMDTLKAKILPDLLPELERLLRQSVYERLKTEAELVRSEKVVEIKRRHRDIERAETEHAKVYASPLCKRIEALMERIEMLRSHLFVQKGDAIACIDEANDIVEKANSHPEITKFAGKINSYEEGFWYYKRNESYAATFTHLVPFLVYVKGTLESVYTE